MTGAPTQDPEVAAPPDADRPVELSEELTGAVADALEQGDVARAAALATPLHAADQADLLEQLGRDDRAALVAQLEPDLDPELLTYLDETVRGEVLEQLGPAQAGAAIAQLETDDAIDILEDLDPTEQMALLETLPMPERAAVEAGLAYPEDSAGRLMQRDFVAAPEFWTVGQTIDYLRANPNLPDDFYDLYIINPRYRAGRLDPVEQGFAQQARRAADRAADEGLASGAGRGGPGEGRLHVPPVWPGLGAGGRRQRPHARRDHGGRRGRRDRGRGAGGHSAADRRGRGRRVRAALQTSLRRVPWLLVNLVTAALAALVIAQFEDAIDRLVVLAVLMPIVARSAATPGCRR